MKSRLLRIPLSTKEIIAYVMLSTGVLIFAPDSLFEKMNAGWMLGLIVFPFSFVAGLLSSWMFYREHDSSQVDPFYLRAWTSVIGGIGALPVCLLVRPGAAHLAFVLFTFGLGALIAFHVFQRNKRKGAE